MFRELKLGAKIGLGFGLLILISLALGGAAWWSMQVAATESSRVAQDYVPQVSIFNHMEVRSLHAMHYMLGYMLSGKEEFRRKGLQNLAGLKESLAEARKLAVRSRVLTRLKGTIDQAERLLAAYERAAANTQRAIGGMNKARQTLDQAGANFINACNAYLEQQNRGLDRQVAGDPELKRRLQNIRIIKDILVRGGVLQVKTLQALLSRDPEKLHGAMAEFAEVERLTAQLKNGAGQADQTTLAEIERTTRLYRQAMASLLEHWRKLVRLEEKQKQIAAEILSMSQGNAEAGLREAQAVADRAESLLGTASQVVLFGSLAALLLGVVLSLLITRSITRPLKLVIKELNAGSDQVAAAANQIAAASQSLAEGASEQAAAVEETSASVEELNAMTKSNADNAAQANTLSQESRRLIQEAQQAMESMSRSMAKIAESGEEISKIIKSIDEIAFQTNLLALNAAVEAARAGEAGAGFAVVADEVRNLAMRAAEAAKNTQELVSETRARIQEGSSLVEDSQESFTKVVVAIEKGAELVGEIASASQEQALGLEQITQAMAEMDKATQQVAANAEEGASASEELSAQSKALRQMVDRLLALAGEVGDGRRSAPALEGGGPVKLLPSPPRRSKGEAVAKAPAPAAKPKAKPKPEEVIPLDDDTGDGDFVDF